MNFSVSLNDREFKNTQIASVNSKDKKEPRNRTLYGNVIYDGVSISTQSFAKNDYIHTIASNYNISDLDIDQGVKKINPDDLYRQSVYVRSYLIKSLAEKLDIGKSNIIVLKNEVTHVPFVQINNSTVDIDVSLSHDAEFISYAYLIR